MYEQAYMQLYTLLYRGLDPKWKYRLTSKLYAFSLTVIKCITKPYLYAVPSGPPTSLNVSAVSSTSIVITWFDPEEFDINGIITGFLLTITDSTGFTLPLISLPARTYSYQRQGKWHHLYTTPM